MAILVILVFVALSLLLAVAVAAAVLWSVLRLMTAMQARTTAASPSAVVADAMPVATRLAA
jgi:hypothetical protein